VARLQTTKKKKKKKKEDSFLHIGAKALAESRAVRNNPHDEVKVERARFPPPRMKDTFDTKKTGGC
jgi:hypothetical protein